MQTLELSEKIKKLNPDVKICLGGYCATYYYDEIFNISNYVDFIVQGEGEDTFRELCDVLNDEGDLNNIKGLIFRNNSDRNYTKNEIRPPFKKIEDFMLKTRKDVLVTQKFQRGELSTSRGCFGQCSFCVSHKFFDPTSQQKWRGIEPKKVVDEIIMINKKYNINTFTFTDASFEDSLNGIERMINILDLLIESNIKATFEVNFRSTIHKKITPDIMKKIIQAGIVCVFLGIEAFNEEDLRLYKKSATL